jgi:hypothetical protein
MAVGHHDVQMPVIRYEAEEHYRNELGGGCQNSNPRKVAAQVLEDD